MKRLYIPAIVAASVLAFAACGGGGSGGSTTYGPTSPTSAPTTPASLPGTGTVSGSAAFVSASNQHTLYTWAGDAPGGASNCTAATGCAGVWPPYTAAAGTVAPSGSGFGIITRSDGTLQWTYQNYPLYMYSGDSAAGQGNGNGINSYGGVWGVARPASSSPGPTSSPSGCIGYYC